MCHDGDVRMRELRSSPRVMIRTHVEFSYTDRIYSDHVATGVAKNIGLGGVFIESDQIPNLGQAVAITLRFRRTPATRVTGVVCRTQGRGFGVKFDPIGHAQTKALTRVVGETRSLGADTV